MKSFSNDIKLEVVSILPDSILEAQAELSAIIKTCGEIRLSNGKEIIVITTEIVELYYLINSILKMIYNEEAELELLDETAFSRGSRYEIYIPEEVSKDCLLSCELMHYDEEKYLCFTEGISKYLVEDLESAKCYIRGAILGAFTCNIVLTNDNGEIETKTNGYHAEFVFDKHNMAVDFGSLLAQFEILSKCVERKGLYVVYVKDLEMISDLLALAGASKSVMALQNESTYRSFKNKINRQNNCITGNLNKVVNASIREVNAIKTIIATIGLESLDNNLNETAMLRLNNPEASIEELVNLSGGTITKSGLYHRLKKLEKIAKELQ